MSATEHGYDRRRELQAFDDTKAGVKGLVDAGVTAVPAIFRHPPESFFLPLLQWTDVHPTTIPVIDLACARREEVVGRVKAAAELMAEMLAAVRRFNEAPAEAKRPYYTRDTSRKVRFSSNYDLFWSPAACWRDTLFCELAPEPPRPEELPEAVRHVMLGYAEAVQKLAVLVLELLSESLGLARDHLTQMGYVEVLRMANHYYPPCPEPHLTLGTSSHSDLTSITVILQDAMGGLQVLLDLGGGCHGWLDVPPLHDALLINVGDHLQHISNGRFRSVQHRVVANKSRDTARVSVAGFFDMIRSPDGSKPSLYRSITVQE